MSGQGGEAVTAALEVIVREAAVVTQAHFGRFRDIEIGIKGPVDFVSDADRASETPIRERLFAIAPDRSLTGEKFAQVEGTDAQHRWLVDPIDGTTNFLNGQHYSITIALRRGAETMCGVIYDPVADEMFTALKGGGAFLNGTPMHVSACRDSALMCIGTGLPTLGLSLYPGATRDLTRSGRPSTRSAFRGMPRSTAPGSPVDA